MDTISVSEFKATCLAVLKKVKRTGRPILVTRRGEPIAQVVPPRPQTAPGSPYGSMAGTAREISDIVAPLPESEWDALK